jgi:hypothetical protein
MAKARISALAAELKPGAGGRRAAKAAAKEPLTVNPARGERGGFLKTTITLPADMLFELRTIGLQRRAAGEKDTGVSEMVRDAVAAYLGQSRGGHAS